MGWGGNLTNISQIVLAYHHIDQTGEAEDEKSVKEEEEVPLAGQGGLI